MSRIILKKYDNGEHHIVVGWDRPVASYFWQEFNKEPEVIEEDGKWKVVSPSHNGVYDTEAEAKEHEWDGWVEMLRLGGYGFNELPNMQEFMNSLPEDLKPLITKDVEKLLRQHPMASDPGRISVDMSTGGS